MKVAGMYAGIGSMLIPSKELGLEVIGNYEKRKEMLTGTFELNFNAPISNDLPKGLDIVFCQPPCGKFSTMGKNEKLCNTTNEIQETLDMLAKIRPKYFVIENLPKSLNCIPTTVWNTYFGDYNIQFELVSNYYYGNVQKHRDRLFIIGSLKTENYTFTPNEKLNYKTIDEVLKDLPKENNISVNENSRSILYLYSKSNSKFKIFTHREIADYLLSIPSGQAVQYEIENGTKRTKIGKRRFHQNSYSFTITGGNPGYHPYTGLPFTVRERARIQGFPDSFIFKLNEKQHITKTGWVQTARSVPIDFIRYLTTQIVNKTKGSGVRLLKPNDIIERYKYACNN